MRIGYCLGYWKAGPPAGALEAVRAAERLGFDSVWTAEAYGSDAFTPLAWWGSQTTRIKLGTAIAQLSARTPTATAMAALTLDHLSGGRVILGLGVSGPQVVEGWYGQPFPKPLARTREYVEIVRDRCSRARRRSPPPARTTRCPTRAGRDRARQAAEARPCTRCAPTSRSTSPPRVRRTSRSPPRSPTAGCRSSSRPRQRRVRAHLAEGFALRVAKPAVAARASRSSLPVAVDPAPDVEDAADMVRPMIALYVGGMGAKGANFHRDVVDRLGYSDEVRQDPGALPRRAARTRPSPRCHARSSRRSPSSARREDPRRARRVGGVGRHHDARAGRRARAAGDRRRAAGTDRLTGGMDDDYADAVLDLVAARSPPAAP